MFVSCQAGCEDFLTRLCHQFFYAMFGSNQISPVTLFHGQFPCNVAMVSVGASYKFLPSFSDHKLILYCTLLQLCLCLLDAVVRYSCLPTNALFDFIAIACRAVNIEKFCQHSWKVTEAELHLNYKRSVFPFFSLASLWQQVNKETFCPLVDKKN